MEWLARILRRSEKQPLVRKRGLRAAGIAIDNPIRRLEDDALGRAATARSFVRQVLDLDAGEGLVVGILGAWGSGKTSFINLARTFFENEGIRPLEFNPWMFSGAQQLVDHFFAEIAAQLKLRSDLAEVGKNLEVYGEAFSGMVWLPVLGPWFARANTVVKLLSKAFQGRRQGVDERREKVKKALADLTKPILIVLDDIDRLSIPEIRDLFKLVRLTASFPNIIYIVAFDRVRVEEALSEQSIPGRDYLEKILQLAVDLPAIPVAVLNQQILAAVDSAVAAIAEPGPFDEQVWPDVFMEIVRPLIRNMRDIRRYSVAIHGTLAALEGRVALADILALEAVRVFLPDVFARLNSAVEALTTTSDLANGGRSGARFKAQIDALIEAAKTQADVVRAMTMLLFPAGQRHIGGSNYRSDWENKWLLERRVAHKDLLGFYLERVVGESLQAFTDAKQAWALMADRGALEAYLRSLDSKRLQDVIAHFEVFENQFESRHVVPGTIVLLNMLVDIPERPLGMFEFDSQIVISRVVFRLLKSLRDPEAVEAAARVILRELNSLSARLQLIGQIGHREDRGHKLVPETVALELEAAWRAEVRASSMDSLAEERNLLAVLLVAKREADSSEPELAMPDAPQFTRAILRAARSEVRSQTMGSRRVTRYPRLAWDELVELYGEEETLGERIKAVTTSGAEGEDDLNVLANRYLNGWRPGLFGSE